MDCIADNTRYDREMRHKRRERLLADPTLVNHGTLTAYYKWMCRCDACYLYNSDACKAWRERRVGRPRTGIRRRYKSTPFGREWLSHAEKA